MGKRLVGRKRLLMKTKTGLYIALLIFVVATACNPWDDTAEVSHISTEPVFEFYDGQYMCFEVNELDTFIDPGGEAYAGDEEVKLHVYNDTAVHVDEVGLYVVLYYAYNDDGIFGYDYRYVAITNKNIPDTVDFTGDYTCYYYSTSGYEMHVSKLNDKGYYKCEEVMGYPGTEMPGVFVNLGKHELALLPGEGDFGDYSASLGSYTLSTLTWTIELEDDSYDGYSVDVYWYKSE